MKRSIVLGVLALAALVGRAEAQLTMQMSNGWSFSFSGNVNAFLTYESVSKSGQTPYGPGSPALVPDSANRFNQTRIQTGLLPAFAVFEAKGKEGNTDLVVHFGFAPQINCASGVHDCFGAQIDMRQVYLTAGGKWGQILAGRELGLFLRQNILTDQTLFGVGATGAAGPGTGGGTTLGRIGFGYIYPQFKAQFTYSTPGGKASQLSVGIFEAASNGPYFTTEIPRLEAEWVYNKKQIKGWLSGTVQTNKDTYDSGSQSATAYGIGGGLRWQPKNFSVTGSGYYGKGIGTTLLFNAGVDVGGVADAGSDDLTKSWGYIGQVTWTPTNSKATIAGSYGSSYIEDSNSGNTANGGVVTKFDNTLISGGLYYQSTKSLKLVAEFDYTWSKEHFSGTGAPTAPNKNSSITPVLGVMLFF